MSLEVKINKNSLFLIFLFIIYPVVTIPYLLYDIYNNRSKLSLVLLACFLGFFGLLYPPTGDLYVYTTKYFLYEGLTFNEFFNYYFVDGRDYILQFILFLLSWLDLNADISRFVYVFTGYFILFGLYRSIVNRNNYLLQNKGVAFTFFLLILLNCHFAVYAYRFYFSLILLLLSFYDLFISKKKIGWIWLILSMLNHFSLFVFIPFFILLKCISLNFSKRVVLLLILSVFILDASFVSIIIKNLPFPSDLITHVMYYIDGNLAGAFLEDHSLLYKIRMYLVRLPLYPILYYYYRNYTITKMTPLMNIMLLLLFVSSPFVVIFSRFIFCTILFYMFYFLFTYVHTKKKFHQLNVLLVAISLSFVCSLWAIRRELSISYEYKLLFQSSFGIISSSYSKDWIYKNVDELGAPIYVE